MRLLTGLAPLPLLLVVFGVVGVFSVASMMLLHHFVKGDARQHSALIATAYMTAIGSLFAIFTGFLLNGEYTQLRDTQSLVFEEVAAGSRLAYSTVGLLDADVDSVQAALAGYLDEVVATEWPALGRSEPGSPEASAALNELQRLVFVTGSQDGVNQSSVDAMKGAVGDITSIRRERLAVASQVMPAPLLILSLITGFALIVNSLAVTLRAGRSYALLAGGIIVVVALDLGAIVGIAAPFSGPFIVDPEPIEQLTVEIRAGDYRSS
jgi:hypothetical protein